MVAANELNPDPYTPADAQPVTADMVQGICTPAERQLMIARAAYFLAQQRGFAPGHELADWLAAEHEINVLCGLVEPHPSWGKPRG